MKVPGPDASPPVSPDAGATVAPREIGEAGHSQGKTKVGDGGTVAESTTTEGSGRAFAERLAGGASSVGAQPPTATAAASNPIARVAADLEAGRVAPGAAVEQVLQHVLSRQLGADTPPAVREKVRAALQDALENDPLLAEKLRRLDS
jgi:hypothetical protein